MYSPHRRRANSHRRPTKGQNSLGRVRFREHAKARRAIAQRNIDPAFDPPEEWHEPMGTSGYNVIVRQPGTGCRHVVTPRQVRTRLSQLPKEYLKDLEIVQLSRMTRKKLCFPCYGLQWGCAIYLYPFEETLDEFFYSPPPQGLITETKMFGGRWERPESNVWRLIWTEAAARDFQLNNVLIHELGHMVDTWNTNYMDQERFAEWFAIEYGYRATGGIDRRRPKRKVRRRHHGT